MNYRYIIVDTGRGDVIGTNDQEYAETVAADQTLYVIDTLTSKWIDGYGNHLPVLKDTYAR